MRTYSKSETNTDKCFCVIKLWLYTENRLLGHYTKH